MINLYQYYSTPETLNGYEDCAYYIPEIALEKIRAGNKDPKLLEVIKKNPHCAWYYAMYILEHR